MRSESVRYTIFLFIAGMITAPQMHAQSIPAPLTGIQNNLPVPWTSHVDIPSDSNDWPKGLDKPLFNASFTDTVNLITDCFNQPVHPTLKLSFYPISLQTKLEDLIEKLSIFSWCIPITYLQTSQYFIVTSPCFVNNGCFTTGAKKLLAPLDNALATYFNLVRHFPLRDSVVIDLHFFSGRVNPRFVIYDSTSIALIHKKIDSLEIKLGTNGISVSKKCSWWPGMRVTYYPLPYVNKAYFPFELGPDSIACNYSNETRVMSSLDRNFFQSIVDILVEENAVSIQGTDTIKAAEFFTTSDIFTRTSYTRQPIKPVSIDKESVFLRSNGKSLDFMLHSPQKAIITIFDVQGRMVDVLFNDLLPSGSSRINLTRKTTSKGTGIIRIQTERFCTHITTLD